LAGQIIKLEKQDGFAIIGSIDIDSDTSFFDTYLLIIDENGDHLKDTVFSFLDTPNEKSNEFGKCIVELKNGNILIVSNLINDETLANIGMKYFIVNKNFEILKISSIPKFEAFSICQKTMDNGFFIVGQYDQNPGIEIVNYEGASVGFVKSTNILGFINSIAQDQNGNTYICGEKLNGKNGKSDGFIALMEDINENTNYTQLFEFGNSENDRLNQIKISKNNELIAIGSTQSLELGNDTYDILILKTDFAGNELGREIIGGNDNEEGIKILEVEENKFIIEATTSLGKNSRITLIKTEFTEE
jgi:hypothetical protein